jgi:hypothetical protein
MLRLLSERGGDVDGHDNLLIPPGVLRARVAGPGTATFGREQ